MPRSLNRSRQGSIRLAGTLLTACLAFASGCLEEDTVTPALREASSRLESLGAPGSAVPGDEFRMGEYRAAIGILRPVATRGSEIQNASASLMIARAEMGLAEIPAGELAQVNQNVYDLAAELRGELSVWSSLNSLADTAASFNPEADLSQINTKIQERDAAIQTERAAADIVRAKVADLERQAQQARAAADELRQQETQLRQQANALDPREALPLHEQASVIRREADAYDMQAEQLMAQADTVRPEIADHDLEIGRLTQQRELLVASTQELAAKGVEGRAQARTLRQQAAEVAKRIENVVNRMETLRTGEGAAKLDATKSAYETALASAGRARTGDRAGAALAAGEIQQTLGNTLGTHAAALAFAADVLAHATRTRTALPGAAAAGASAQSYASLAQSAQSAAVESLIAARESFGSAGLRAEEAERIERVNAELDAMIQSLGGPAAQAEAAPEEDASFNEEPTEDWETFDEDFPADDAEESEEGQG